MTREVLFAIRTQQMLNGGPLPWIRRGEQAMMQAQRLSGLATIVLAATWVSSCGGDKSAAGPGVDLKTRNSVPE